MFALHQPATVAPPLAAPDASSSSAELPLQSRIWHLFCQGYSHTAIGEQVGLERHAVARHVRAVEALLAKEHVDDLALARHRALEASYTLLALAFEHLTVEGQREDAIWRDYERALADLPSRRVPLRSPVDDAPAASPALPTAASPTESSLPPPPVKYYRAGSTRLLGIALASLRQAIRLSGLNDDAAGIYVPPPALPLVPPAPPSVPPPATLPAPDAPPPLDAPPHAVPLAPSDAPAAPAHHASAVPAPSGAARPPAVAHLSPDHATPSAGTKWNISARPNRPPATSAQRQRPHTSRHTRAAHR